MAIFFLFLFFFLFFFFLKVGSIDNDMCGISMTIGADTALQRIVTAVDALVTWESSARYESIYICYLSESSGG